MFLQALQALNEDKETEVIVLVSKPPHEDVLKKIAVEIKKIKKPVVAIFIGASAEVIKASGAIPASTLEEASLIAVALSKGKKIGDIKSVLEKTEETIKTLASNLLKNKKKMQEYLRGLYSGGTLCDETQLILKEHIGYVYSNTPLNKYFKLIDAWKSKENSVVDMGDDEFTVGRPHPMIDFSLRNKKIVEEASDPEVAVILLDVVLGYGSNLNPASELVPTIKKAKEISPDITIICSITGTENDPQNRADVNRRLEIAGAIVMQTNASASKLAAYIIK
jgi:FdrA protein